MVRWVLKVMFKTKKGAAAPGVRLGGLLRCVTAP